MIWIKGSSGLEKMKPKKAKKIEVPQSTEDWSLEEALNILYRKGTVAELGIKLKPLKISSKQSPFKEIKVTVASLQSEVDKALGMLNRATRT